MSPAARVIPGINDMATSHPELAAQADGWDPTSLVAGTHKKLAWRCVLGHSWIAKGSDRASKGSGCPYCSNQSVLSGFNDMATTHPDLASQADGWDPSTVIAGTHRKLAWRCVLGHSWIAEGSYRASKGSACPYCSNQSVLPGFNDIATTHPELAIQADGWDPSTVIAGTHKKLAWRCADGHPWLATASHRSVSKSGCPYCSNQSVLSGFNDMATTQPDLASQADGWDPATVMAGTSKTLKWCCELGHTWLATGSDRMSGTGCPNCSNRVVLSAFNDMATTHPELAAQADGWDPTTVVAGSGKILAWHCEHGHRWRAKGSDRVNGSGCPYCSNQSVLSGFNDMATTHPDLASQADGWDPTTVVAGSGRILAWCCELGHRWRAAGKSRASRGDGCPYCANKVVLAGFNDMATTHPELAAQADGWDPATVIAGTHKKLKWRCADGHMWRATGSDRVNGRGCPNCAKFGFSPVKDGYLYLIQHEVWGLLQIGISNVPDDRLASHKRNGWRVLDVRGPMPGEITYGWEKSILSSLTQRGIALAPVHVAGIFSGYTESWIEGEFLASSLKELMSLVHGDESGSDV